MTPFIPLSTYVASNGFGQYDPKYYPLTKHHIGSDFRVAVGTPIVAPCDGELFKSLVSGPKGNVGIFIFEYQKTLWGLELCHLKELPALGKFSQGEKIALSGNTGSATTGPHLHAVMHRDATVTKNYKELTNEEAFVRLWREGRIVDTFLWFAQKV